jgi:hypothetical protein
MAVHFSPVQVTDFEPGQLAVQDPAITLKGVNIKSVLAVTKVRQVKNTKTIQDLFIS